MVHLSANYDLSVDANEIYVGFSSGITTSGTGNITFTATQSISIANDSISSNNGDITLSELTGEPTVEVR